MLRPEQVVLLGKSEGLIVGVVRAVHAVGGQESLLAQEADGVEFIEERAVDMHLLGDIIRKGVDLVLDGLAVAVACGIVCIELEYLLKLRLILL